MLITLDVRSPSYLISITKHMSGQSVHESPYATLLWRIGDSSKKNGVHNMALERIKKQQLKKRTKNDDSYH